MNFSKNLFVTDRFFYVMAGLTVLMMSSYAFSFLLPVVKTLCLVFVTACIVDALLLFNRRIKVFVTRETAPVFSLGDENPVRLLLSNRSGLRLKVQIIDELPEQFQIRNFSIDVNLPPHGTI